MIQTLEQIRSDPGKLEQRRGLYRQVLSGEVECLLWSWQNDDRTLVDFEEFVPKGSLDIDDLGFADSVGNPDVTTVYPGSITQPEAATPTQMLTRLMIAGEMVNMLQAAEKV